MSKVRGKKNGKYNGKSTAPLLLLLLVFLNAVNLISNGDMQSYDPFTPTNNETQPSTSKKVANVAYVVTITSCRPKFRRILFDAAMVLKQSVELNSYPLHPYAKYAPHFHAILHYPSPPDCVRRLELAGYAIHQVEYPVLPKQIDTETHGDFLRKSIEKDGCCGHAELMKLNAFNMTEYPIAVHMDLDTLLLQPLDELLDIMYFEPRTPEGQQARLHFVQQELAAPTYQFPVEHIENMTVDHMFTNDYNQLPPGREHAVGIQGGFFVVRPNATRRDELVDMVKTGHYLVGFDGVATGWFGSGYGKHIWGSMTIQGLLAYYFDKISPSTSIELHRCKFNSIADNPRRTTWDPRGKYPRGTPLNQSAADWQDTSCRDGRDDCEDVQCQTWPVEDTRLFHYTCNCKMPWSCRQIDSPVFLYDGTCKYMIAKWFEVRKSLVDRGLDNAVADGQYQTDSSLGYCRNATDYVFIQQ